MDSGLEGVGAEGFPGTDSLRPGVSVSSQIQGFPKHRARVQAALELSIVFFNCDEVKFTIFTILGACSSSLVLNVFPVLCSSPTTCSQRFSSSQTKALSPVGITPHLSPAPGPPSSCPWNMTPQGPRMSELMHLPSSLSITSSWFIVWRQVSGLPSSLRLNDISSHGWTISSLSSHLDLSHLLDWSTEPGGAAPLGKRLPGGI